ncbi:MAG: hypothetical protein GY835_01345, partial [bacterium]|nr:hypothetical protein [bacterium]
EQEWLAVEKEYGEELEVMSAGEYSGRTFTRPDGGDVVAPGVGPDVASVVVRKEKYLYTESIPLVLLTSPLDLMSLDSIPEDHRAVLLEKNGQVLATAKVNIGFRTAFYTPMGTTVQEKDPGNPGFLKGQTLKGFNHFTDQLCGPIMGAKVYVPGHPKGASDAKGVFRVKVPFNTMYYLLAELRYTAFDPQSGFN